MKKNGGYLTGETNYIFSVVSMHPAENPDFILYVTVQQPEHYSGVQLGSLPTQSLSELLPRKNPSIFSQLLRAWIRSARRQVMPCQLPRTLPQVTSQKNCVVTLSNQSLSEQELRSRNSRFLKEIIWKPISIS